MDGWMDGWMDGCMDAWMHGCMDAWMHGCMDAASRGHKGWILEPGKHGTSQPDIDGTSVLPKEN